MESHGNLEGIGSPQGIANFAIGSLLADIAEVAMTAHLILGAILAVIGILAFYAAQAYRG